MSDKLRSAFPISVNFSDGELPTAAKLRGLARQAKNGLSIVEYALGDLWNQGGDNFLSEGGTSTDNALMIANLARYVGGTKLTSPRVPYLSSLNTYTHLFYTGDGFVGTQEAYLTFPPTGGSSYTWAGGATYDATPKATKGEVLSSTQWYVDTTNGYCYFGSQLTNGFKVTFTPDTTKVTDQETTSGFNIIPSPYTNTGWSFRGCKIAYANNTDNSQGYVIYFPPRGPLDWHVLDRGPQDSFLHGNSDNYDSTPDSATTLMFWQDPTAAAATNASTASHYRYQLPYALQNSVYFDVSATLPVGFVHLWDHYVTQTIITGITITLDSSAHTWAIVVSGSAMDTWVTNNLTACGYPADSLTQRDTHTSSYYPANGLRVITIGSSLSDNFSSLSQKFYDHDHGSGSSLCGKPIDHSKLLGLFEKVSEFPIDASAWDKDDHPQYLSRLGCQPIGSVSRDRYLNGMFGDLLFLSTVDTGNYQNLDDDSLGIVFGHSTTGPKIYYNLSYDALILANKNLALGSTSAAWIHFVSSATKVFGLSDEPGIVVASISSDETERAGGSVHANRFKAGRCNEGSYGYSAGTIANGYGPVRKHILPLSTFISGEHNATVFSLDALDITDTSYHTYGEKFYANSVGSSSIVEEAVYYMSNNIPAGAGNKSHIIHIDLPYQSYVIVNVILDFYHNTLTNINQAVAFLVQNQYAAGVRAHSTTAYADLYSLHTTASTWSGQKELASPSSTPLVTVDNTGSYSVPFSQNAALVNIKLASSWAGYVLLRNLTVLYRVKEF